MSLHKSFSRPRSLSLLTIKRRAKSRQLNMVNNANNKNVQIVPVLDCDLARGHFLQRMLNALGLMHELEMTLKTRTAGCITRRNRLRTPLTSSITSQKPARKLTQSCAYTWWLTRPASAVVNAFQWPNNNSCTNCTFWAASAVCSCTDFSCHWMFMTQQLICLHRNLQIPNWPNFDTFASRTGILISFSSEYAYWDEFWIQNNWKQLLDKW